MRTFVGRHAELAVLRERLRAVRGGRPRVVLVRGSAGIGKTGLVERFLADPGGSPAPIVLRANGEESEALLAHGVIDQLLRSAVPALGELRKAPEPGADPVTVGAGLLDLLGAAGERPVVVVVDDLQWADGPSLRALIFTARRLVADPVLMVLAVRDDGAVPEGVRRLVSGHLGGELALGGLDEGDLAELARELGAGPLATADVRRLREGTEGSPLHARAVLEEFPPGEWGAPDAPLPSPRSFRRLVQGRYAACGDASRALVDAAAVLGDRCLLPQAATVAGLDGDAAAVAAVDGAVAADLLTVAWTAQPWSIAFPHPLVRSAILDAIGPARRLALHAAAAGVVPQERAALRHRVAAAPGPDAALAGDLERCAEAEAGRQQWPSAAAHLLAAARLAADRGAGEARLLRAVTWMIQTGDAARAAAHAEEVAAAAPGPARDLVLGSLAMARGDPEGAGRLLGAAWRACGPGTDPELTAAIALQCAIDRYGRLDAPGTERWSLRALERTGAGTAVHHSARTYLAHALGYAGRTGQALAAVGSADADPGDAAVAWLQPRSARGALRLATDDLDGARGDLGTVADAARSHGVLNTAAFALAFLARVEYLAGDWDTALLHAERAIAVNDESAFGFMRWMVLGVAALVPAARGDAAAVEALLGPARLRYPGDYERSVVAVALARGGLAEALGDPGGVLAALDPVRSITHRDAVDEPGFWAWPDLCAEALAALGRPAEADALLRPHEARADERGLRSAIARLARARGRVEAAAGRPERAEQAFERALAVGAEPLLPFDRARVELAAGAFHRRAGRRRRAADLLGAAEARFIVLEAAPWARRCAAEIAATGLRPARRDDARAGLTAQEAVVARLVAAGRSNREVAAELVVSVKTVEYHLRNAYHKLGVRRRRELADALAGPAGG